MPSEYKPHGLHAAPFNPLHCKAIVHQGRGFSYQCLRNAKIDGWCKQHHPDAVKARQEESDRKFREKMANLPEVRLRARLNEVIEQRDALLAVCERFIEIEREADDAPRDQETGEMLYDLVEALMNLYDDAVAAVTKTRNFNC